jgi:hypothetical protein
MLVRLLCINSDDGIVIVIVVVVILINGYVISYTSFRTYIFVISLCYVSF